MKTGRMLGFGLFASGVLAGIALAEESMAEGRWQALKCPVPSLGQSWKILDRDGAGRQVTPYLSSLAGGEAGTGMITSPPFIIDVDTITFTLCGHDGQAGGAGKNCIALVDARKGQVLMMTPAPQNDAMQERSWDVKGLRGTQVRIELRDGNDGSGFAWFGVGRIHAGPDMTIEFSQGLPKDWAQPDREADVCYETLAEGVPFRRPAGLFTLIPKQGAVEIPCGFAARRLFLLGGTVADGRPLHTYGGIEIHYQIGSPDVFPLMCGFTVDTGGKLLSPSKALRLLPSADPYQPYLVIAPRADVIEKIRLVADPAGPLPRITAITCQSDAVVATLSPLPDPKLSSQQTEQIEKHSISAETLDLNQAMQQIREANKLPAPSSSVHFRKHRLDARFRSEGVCVADFNGDGVTDIAAGNVYYAGPDWMITPLQGQAREFNRNGYSDAFLCYADDLNGDHAIDLIVVGFPGQQTHWLENPGTSGGEWNKHLAIEQTGNENPAYADVDGDGRRELVFMHGDKCAFAQPGADPTQPWVVRPIAGAGDPAAGHGMGVGDVNGDGRFDVVIPDGWWEAPAEAGQMPWPFHPATLFGGAQLCVADLDQDGDADVLGSSPHAYGICWAEQTPEGFTLHPIDNSISQTHALAVVDMDGDGLLDFVTGKRFWAHNGHDPGSFQPSLLCWYQQTRKDDTIAWTMHIIDAASGVGLQFQIVDVNRDDKPDIVTSNKSGVFYFEQLASRVTATR